MADVQYDTGFSQQSVNTLPNGWQYTQLASRLYHKLTCGTCGAMFGLLNAA